MRYIINCRGYLCNTVLADKFMDQVLTVIIIVFVPFGLFYFFEVNIQGTGILNKIHCNVLRETSTLCVPNCIIFIFIYRDCTLTISAQNLCVKAIIN